MWFFVSDLHGRLSRYERLFERIRAEEPAAVLLGGDLLPHRMTDVSVQDFVRDFLAARVASLRDVLRDRAPRILLILGNDDPRREEAAFIEETGRGLWDYIHDRTARVGDFQVYGYSCVPPSPFLLKDWERYDVSRFVDIGCVAPEDGRHTVPIDEHELRFGTMAEGLERLFANADADRTIGLFHAPPHGTALDRVLLRTAVVDHAPLDPHVGSIAIRRFVEMHQPRVTLHGHIHEAARLTGQWREQIGRTLCLGGAHDGPELALVRFDPQTPDAATRELLT